MEDLALTPPPIHLRLNWKGNDPHQTFEAVDDAIAYARQHSDGCYEILNAGVPVRPYGDWDENIPVSITPEAFEDRRRASSEYLWSLHPDIALADASAYSKSKISFHWTIPTEYVDSTAHAKQYAVQLYGKTIPYVDWSIYDARKKFRCVYTSKPKEHRPLVPLNCNPSDTFVQYIPSSSKKVHIELPLKKASALVVPPPPSDVPRTIETDQTIFTIAELLAVWRWDDRSMCRNLIWGLCDGGANNSVIHHYCKKSAKYDAKWVDSIIAAFNPARQDRITMGTIRHFAKEDDPVGVKRFDGLIVSVAIEEITKLTTNATTIFEWMTEKGYLRTLPDHPTQAVKAQMETGKTTIMRALCTPSMFNPIKSVLIISARKSYTAMIGNDLGKLFACYDTYKTKKKGDRGIDEPYLICSIQSLYRVLRKSYDLVILDECETILASLTPNKTHGSNYLLNIEALERVVRTATRVLCMDAFTTDRTTEFLNSLRPSVQIIINPHQPHTRTALLFNKSRGGEKGFLEHVRNQVDAGKKMVCVWATKPIASEFHSTLKCSNQLYTADSDPSIKARHCADVNTYWVEPQCIGYSPAVTIGLNYQAKPSFDVCAFTTSSWSCNPRDTAQSLHRARHLNDDHYIGFVETDAHRDVACLNTGMTEMERYANQDNVSRAQFLKDIGEQVVDYERLPNWLLRVLLRNRNELITGRKYPTECMEYYLKACGITFKYTPVSTDFLKKKPDGEDEEDCVGGTEYDDIPLIEDEEADELLRGRFSTELTLLDQMKIAKFLLSKKVPPSKIDGFILSKWMAIPEIINNAFNEIHSSPMEQLRILNASNKKKVLDLLSPEIQQLKIMQSFGFNYAQEFCIPVQDVPKADLTCFGIRDRSSKDTSEQYCRNLVKAVKVFNGTTLNIVKQRSRKGDEYSLTYQPKSNSIVSYIQPKLSAAELFRAE